MYYLALFVRTCVFPLANNMLKLETKFPVGVRVSFLDCNLSTVTLNKSGDKKLDGWMDEIYLTV